MAEQQPFGDIALASNPEPRCPCVLLLDVSGSMAEVIADAGTDLGYTVQQDGQTYRAVSGGVTRIDQPEALLVAPEQAFYLRENLKLMLLNARLSLLARQNASARADVSAAVNALHKYFDPSSRRTQAVATQLQQVQAQVRSTELPRIDDTLAALATAAAGR